MGVLDVPNKRSSHARPVIRGAGLAPLLAIVVGYAILLLGSPEAAELIVFFIVLGVSLAAGMLGWIEDVRGVPVVARAGLQLAIGLAGAFAVTISVGGSWWLAILYAVGIAGYINVANFMDGVNGISGLHGLVVGVTYAVAGTMSGMPWLSTAGWILALAFVGFLPWNLRGGIFLGDVGSYLLGGGVAIVAIAAITHGVAAAVIIAPLVVYLVDTGATLGRRIVRGQRWFEAHRSHVYQRLTDSGFSHVQVALIVTVASLCLGALGLLTEVAPKFWIVALVLATLIIAAYFLLVPIRVVTQRRRSRIRRDGGVG